VRGGFKWVPANVRPEITEINGQIAVLGWNGDHLYGLITLEFTGDKITAIRAVFNPDKLAALQKTSPSEDEPLTP
jgi:hypothetical protein